MSDERKSSLCFATTVHDALVAGGSGAGWANGGRCDGLSQTPDPVFIDISPWNAVGLNPHEKVILL